MRSDRLRTAGVGAFCRRCSSRRWNRLTSFYLDQAAAEGVDHDGLRVAYDANADAYTFETPDLRRTGLSEGELDRVARANADYVTNWDFFRGRSDDRRAGPVAGALLLSVETRRDRGSLGRKPAHNNVVAICL